MVSTPLKFSQKYFCISSVRSSYYLREALIFTEKLSRSSWKPQKPWKFSPANLFLFTVVLSHLNGEAYGIPNTRKKAKQAILPFKNSSQHNQTLILRLDIIRSLKLSCLIACTNKLKWLPHDLCSIETKFNHEGKNLWVYWRL